ncbi:MAG: hypothetical protein GQ523_04030 [Methanophagales archaeon]|nr:hypothetical protein [Methanophagales archaeon]
MHISTRPSPNLIGLEREWQELKESVETGRILLIRCEIGTGKTSLLLWLTNTIVFFSLTTSFEFVHPILVL